MFYGEKIRQGVESLISVSATIMFGPLEATDFFSAFILSLLREY